MAKCNTCRHRDKRNIDFPCIDCYLPEAEHYTPIVNEWISVKDRLPEKGLLVLCVGAKGGMFLGKDLVVYNGDNCAYAKVPNSRNSRNAVYWMPLPEPPEEA